MLDSEVKINEATVLDILSIDLDNVAKTNVTRLLIWEVSSYRQQYNVSNISWYRKEEFSKSKKYWYSILFYFFSSSTFWVYFYFLFISLCMNCISQHNISLFYFNINNNTKSDDIELSPIALILLRKRHR